jgi:hypothetical protein
MLHYEVPVHCPSCRSTFTVEYQPDHGVSGCMQIAVTCPHCAGTSDADLPRPALIFLAKPLNTPPTLSRRDKPTAV